MAAIQSFVHQDTTFDFGEEPQTVQRRCTDVPCCILLLPCLAAFGWVSLWGVQNGDLRRLHGFPDSQGRLCGVSEEVKDSPILFFCQDEHGHLSGKNSYCVQQCPDVNVDAEGRRMFGQKKQSKKSASNTAAGKCLHGHLPDRPECCIYHTRPFGEMLCLPKSTADMRQLVEEWESPMVEWVMRLGEALRLHRSLLAIAALAAIGLSSVYLLLVHVAASCILWSLLLALVSVLGAAGAYLVLAPFGFGSESIPTSGDNAIDFGVGSVALICTAALMFIACCLCDYINHALATVEEASECIRDRWSLILQPLLDTVIRLGTMFLLAWGFLLLASCLTQDAAERRSRGGDVKFLETYGQQEYAFMVFYVLFSWYLLELFCSMSYFMVAYVTQQWFFRAPTKQLGCCSLVSAFCSCLFYHLGTVAYGSFAIMVFRIPRELIQLQVLELEDTGAVVPRACSCACACCLDAFEGFLRYMTRIAYMDVAINSNNFCKAAYFSTEMMLQVSRHATSLRTTSFIFQLLGMGGIGASCAAITHFLAVHVPLFADEDSKQFVQHPILIDGIAAVIGSLLSWPFVHLLPSVAKVILFCESLDDYRHLTPSDELEERARASRSFFSCCGVGGPKKGDSVSTLSGYERGNMTSRGNSRGH